MRAITAKNLSPFSLLVFFSVLLFLLLVFMSVRADYNTRSAEQWKEGAVALRAQASELEKRLRSAEQEIASLQSRQESLASEKARAEDSRKLLIQSSAQLLAISSLQRTCAREMNRLAVAAYARNWKVVKGNYDKARLQCQDAEQRFDKLLLQLGVGR